MRSRARILSVLTLSLLVSAQAAAQSQDDAEPAEPAFSLSSSEVYTTRDSPAFNLTFRHLPQLDFRVYRVRDPFAFFAGLRDPHELGSLERPVAQEKSWIERIADWKAGQRREIRRFVDERRPAVHFPVEFRLVKADDIWLSPASGRDSAYIAVHMYRGMPYRAYFDGVEAIFRNHGGRPHWGKMHTRTAAELEALYPEWGRFHEVRRRLDPRGLFLNPYLRALFGEPAAFSDFEKLVHGYDFEGALSALRRAAGQKGL